MSLGRRRHAAREIARLSREGDVPPGAVLGSAHRDARKAMGHSLRSFATEVTLSVQTVVRLEKGEDGVSLGHVIQSLDALGLELAVVKKPRGPSAKDAEGVAPADVKDPGRA